MLCSLTVSQWLQLELGHIRSMQGCQGEEGYGGADRPLRAKAWTSAGTRWRSQHSSSAGTNTPQRDVQQLSSDKAQSSPL